jgi:hypothetical protein
VEEKGRDQEGEGEQREEDKAAQETKERMWPGSEIVRRERDK